jgi:hypothetical protein
VAPGELRETSALGSGESGEMVMRVLIVYESIYGSNLRIARAVAAGIGGDATTTIVGAQAAPAAVDAGVDLIVVGGPNHMARLPTAASRAEAVAKDRRARAGGGGASPRVGRGARRAPASRLKGWTIRAWLAAPVDAVEDQLHSVGMTTPT